MSDPVTLREHIEGRMRALEQRIDESMRAIDIRFEQRFTSLSDSISAAMSASDRAITKAELAADKRYEALNELRGMANDTLARTMTRDECEQRFNAVTEKLDSMQARIDRREGGGAGLQQGWVVLVGLAALVAAAVSVFGFLTSGNRP